MFTQLREHKLKAKCSKCEFACSHIKYLGHVVGSGELCVDPNKVSAVTDWAAPHDIKGVRLGSRTLSLRCRNRAVGILCTALPGCG